LCPEEVIPSRSLDHPLIRKNILNVAGPAGSNQQQVRLMLMSHNRQPCIPKRDPHDTPPSKKGAEHTVLFGFWVLYFLLEGFCGRHRPTLSAAANGLHFDGRECLHSPLQEDPARSCRQHLP